MQIIKSRCKYLVLLLLLIFNFQVGLSQETTENKLLLIEALPQIEQQFAVKFTYVDEVLDGIYITPFDYSSSFLSELLKKLSNQTQLIFSELSKNNYAISENPELSVCATIIDAENKERIFGATIEVVGKSMGVLSTEDGSFKLINISRNDSLHIRYLGYNIHATNVGKLLDLTNCPTIGLKRKYEALNEVVITEYLTVGITKQKDGVIKMKPKDFGILPGLAEPDVLQAIQALPGVKSIDETISDINIRGGTNDQNLVLWDNIRMFQLGHFFGLISAFNPYVTEQISVTKNGASSEYGDGVSSVLDMRTSDEVETELNGGGGINLIGADVYLNTPVNDELSFQVSGRRSGTDLLATPTYNRYFDKAFQDSKITNIVSLEEVEEVLGDATFFFYDVTAKALYDHNENQRFRLSFINIANKLVYEEKVEDDLFNRKKESTLDQNSLAFGGNWSARWSNRLTTEFSGYYTKYKLNALNFTLFSDQRLLQTNQVLETGFKLTSNYDLKNDRISLRSGYQFAEIGIINITDINIPQYNETRKDVLRNHAVFSEYNYASPTGKLNARAGLRANYFETLDRWTLEPRLNLVYKVNTELTAQIRGEMKSQTSTQEIDLQDNFLGVEKRRWELSNDGTRPITQSKQLSLELSHDKNNLLISLSGFYKDVDGITTSNQGFQNQNQFLRREGSYSLSGIEFLANKKATNFSTWLGYSYNVNNYTFSDLDPGTFRNNLDVRHAVTLAATYTWKKIRFAVGSNWRTGRPFTIPEAGNELTINNETLINTINYDIPNGENLEDYWRTDFSAIYKFSLGDDIKATAGAALLNIFNKQNTLNIYYRLDTPQSTEIQQVEQLSLGLTPNFSFRVQF